MYFQIHFFNLVDIDSHHYSLAPPRGDHRASVSSEVSVDLDRRPSGTHQDDDLRITRSPGSPHGSRCKTPPDRKTREYLFPNSSKDTPVKAPNVTVLHPAAHHHPLLTNRVHGSPGRISFAPPHHHNSTGPLPHHSTDLLLRAGGQVGGSSLPQPFIPPAPSNPGGGIDSSTSQSTESRLSTFAHPQMAPPSPLLESTGHLAAASLQAHQIWLQNCYAAALQQLPSHYLSSMNSRYLLGASPSHGTTRFAPYVLPHSLKDEQTSPAGRASNSSVESGPNSPTITPSHSNSISGGNNNKTSPLKTATTVANNSIVGHTKPEVTSVQKTSMKTSSDGVKHHSPKSNSFTIASLTAKD